MNPDNQVVALPEHAWQHQMKARVHPADRVRAKNNPRVVSNMPPKGINEVNRTYDAQIADRKTGGDFPERQRYRTTDDSLSPEDNSNSI